MAGHGSPGMVRPPGMGTLPASVGPVGTAGPSRDGTLQVRSGMADDRRIERLVAGWPDALVEIDRSGIVLEWNAGAETAFGWRRDEVVGAFVGDTFLTGSFAKSPFGLLAADTTGASGAPMTGSVTDGTLDLELDLRHRDGRRIRTKARMVVLGQGRARSVAAFFAPRPCSFRRTPNSRGDRPGTV